MGVGRKCCKFGGPRVRELLGTWRLSRHCAAGLGLGVAGASPAWESRWTSRAASRQWEPRAAKRVGGHAHPLSNLLEAKDVGWGDVR